MVVTVPPVLVVFKVMSASQMHTHRTPALSKVTLLALPAIKLPEDLVISFLGYIVFPFKSKSLAVNVKSP